MPAFEYTALDGRGRQKKGVIEGDSPRQVRQSLRVQGLSPLRVSGADAGPARAAASPEGGAPAGEAPREGAFAAWRRRRKRLKASELALFTRQLSTLLNAGTPLAQALAIAQRQAQRADAQAILLGVRARVMDGRGLAQSLRAYPLAFPELVCATVAAGEQSGHLEAVLERIADYTEASEETRQKAGTALIYPVLLVIVSVAIVAGLMAYVVPKVVGVFADTGQPLPLLTRALLALSEFLHAWGLALAFALAAGALAFRRALRVEHRRLRWHRFLLRLPLLGRLLKGLDTARFAHTLSILASANVPILDALTIAGQVVALLPMRQAIAEAAARVREGAGIAGSLDKTGVLPPMTIQLIASGEASGRLESMLERAARQQERETNMLIANALAIFEPALILVMGLVVLMIVLAILLPIFELNQLIH